MTDREVKLVGGFGHSDNSNKPDVITNIGAKGTNFSGTFSGRSAYYAFDFVASVYTDKDDVLYIIWCANPKIAIVFMLFFPNLESNPCYS